MLHFAHSPDKIILIRLCMVDCLVKMVSHWKTSGRLTGTDSLQTQVRSDSRCSSLFQTGLKKSLLERKTGTFPTPSSIFPTGPMCDLLWSDPQPQVSSHPPNPSLGLFGQSKQWFVLEQHSVHFYFGLRIN